MPDQRLGDCLRVRRMTLHPHGQSFDAANGEPGVQRSGDRSCGELQEADLLGQLVIVEHEGTAEHIRVVECTTTSAPKASGFCKYGEANVLSTTTTAPAEWPISASAAMSEIFMSGLLGVSSQSSRVPRPTLARTASRSDSSTVSRVIPHGT